RISGASYHKGSERRYIERVFTITSRTAKIDQPVVREVQLQAEIEHCVPEPFKFLHADAPHAISRHKRGDLRIIILAGGNTGQNFIRFTFAEGLEFEQVC